MQYQVAQYTSLLKHRVIHYCYHLDYVFKVKKIIFLKNLNNIKDEQFTLFIDQNFFKEFIDLVPKKNIQLYTILWNGDFDYALYLKEIKQIHKKYNSFKIITQNNFYKNNNIPLNRFELSKKKNLKEISGISFYQKIKYFNPLLYSLYNFLRYFRKARKLFF